MAVAKTTTKPGTVDETAQKVARKVYREEDAALLTAIPTDWDNALHHGLKRKDFAEDAQHLHFEWMADRAQKRADDLRQRAAEWKETGGLRVQKRENQYKALLAKIASLEAELSAGNIDIEALKASVTS